MQYGSDGAGDMTLGATQEGLRVSNVRRTSFPYVVANEPTTSVAQTTEVDLLSFVAMWLRVGSVGLPIGKLIAGRFGEDQ